MPALEYALLVEQGSDYRRAIPVFDRITKQSQDVTGWTAAGQIRATPTSDSVLCQLDLTPDGTDVMLFIPAAESSTWTWTKARYDIEVTSPSGDKSRIIKGLVIVDPEVTRG
jgi:hypothetical protein